MSKSAAFENAYLKLIFNGVAIANLADNASASPLTNLYLALHTADPGSAGSQSTNEVSYTGYARVAVVRTSSGWVVSGSTVSPATAVEFGEMTSGTPSVATHLSVGIASTGAGMILYSGAITPSVNLNIGVVPRLRTTSTITED